MTSTVSNNIKRIPNKTYDTIKGLSGKAYNLIKNPNKNEDIYPIYNYSINFYNDIFMNDIYNIINERRNDVRTNFIKLEPNKIGNKIEENKIKKVKDKQQERIIKDYLIPLSYLIYSYIYQKFYVVQQRKDIILENKLNYKMYQYFFSHKNPIIKKVNVYFYNIYNNLLPNNNKNNKNSKNKFNSNKDLILPKEIEQYIIPEIRKGKTKDELIAFLNEVSNKISINDDTIIILKNIINNLNILDKKIIDITKIITDILNKIKNKYTDDYNKIIGIIKTADELLIDKAIDILSYNEIKDFDLFVLYKNDYDKIFLKYKDIYRILTKINQNILNIYLSEEESNFFIIEEDVSKNKIDSYIDFYKRKKKSIEDENKIYNNTVDINNILNSFFNDEKELIKEYFNSINNEKEFNNYLNEINIVKKNININIYKLIYNLNGKPINNSIITKNINEIFNNIIDIDIDIDNNKNLLFKILSYIYISILYEENYEFNYFLNIFNLLKYDNDFDFKSIIISNDKISDIIKDYKFKYNNVYREYKKNSNNNNNIFKTELINRKIEYNEYIVTTKNDIIDLDNEITEKDFIKKINEKKTKFDEKNRLYTTEKLKKNKLNSELLNLSKITIAKQYEIKALDKISDKQTRARFDKYISEFITSKTTTTTSSGITTKNPPSDADIIYYIKKLVEEQIKKNKNIKSNNNITIIKKNKEKFEKEKFEFEIEYNDILKKKDLYTLYNDSYEKNYIQEIDKIIKNIDLNRIKDEQNKKDIKDILNNEFNLLIQLIEKIEKIDNINKFNNTKNKIYFFIEQDDIFKNKFFINNSEVNTKIQKNFNNIHENTKTKLLKNINSNLKQELKLNNITNSNNKIKKILKYSYLNEYIDFLNKYFTEQKFIFIDQINLIYKNLKEDDEIIPFFEEYMNHFKKLSLKINNILNQINQDIIIFKTEKMNDLDPYFNIIIKKIENIKKINNNSDENINNRGKFTTILPYTDSMFLYIIYLTLIIDYLTFFYE